MKIYLLGGSEGETREIDLQMIGEVAIIGMRPEVLEMPQEACILRHDNSITLNVCPMNGTDFSPRELRNIVRGNIEIVPVPYVTDERVMVFNADFLKLELPLNQNASLLRLEEIRGNALVCRREQIK